MPVEPVVVIVVFALLALVFWVAQALDRRAKGITRDEVAPISNYLPFILAAAIFIAIIVFTRLLLNTGSDQMRDFISAVSAVIWGLVFLVWYWRRRQGEA